MLPTRPTVVPVASFVAVATVTFAPLSVTCTVGVVMVTVAPDAVPASDLLVLLELELLELELPWL